MTVGTIDRMKIQTREYLGHEIAIIWIEGHQDDAGQGYFRAFVEAGTDTIASKSKVGSYLAAANLCNRLAKRLSATDNPPAKWQIHLINPDGEMYPVITNGYVEVEEGWEAGSYQATLNVPPLYVLEEGATEELEACIRKGFLNQFLMATGLDWFAALGNLLRQMHQANYGEQLDNMVLDPLVASLFLPAAMQAENEPETGVRGRSDNEPEPHWQPISQLSLFTHMVDGIWETTMEQHETFSGIEDQPHVLDDALVARIQRVFGDQLDGLWVYEEQFHRWLADSLSTRERKEVKRLARMVGVIREKTEAILAMMERMQHGTIEKVMGKSDLELGLDAVQRDIAATGSLQPGKEPAPALQKLAETIHNYVKHIQSQGGGDEKLLETMADYMPMFKRILDEGMPGDLNALCEQFDGLFRFAKLLELLAGGIADGIIDVPDDPFE